MLGLSGQNPSEPEEIKINMTRHKRMLEDQEEGNRMNITGFTELPALKEGGSNEFLQLPLEGRTPKTVRMFTALRSGWYMES